MEEETTHTPAKSSGFRFQVSGLSLLFGVFLLFATVQLAWLLMDSRPLMEERHFVAAAELAQRMHGTPAGRAYPSKVAFAQYPPLLACWTAPFLAVFGCRGDVAVLSLLPFAWLLMWATWKTARFFVSPPAACTAAVLVLCFHHFMDLEPFMASYSFIKEYLLDLPLSAWVALSTFLMITCLRDTRMAPRIGLGLAMAAGVLTKISFPLYMAIIVLALLLAGFRDRQAWKRALLIPGVLAAILAAPWVLLHLGDLFEFLRFQEWNPAVTERDGLPPLKSVTNLLYYPQALLNIMSLPLLLLAGAAAVLGARSRTRAWKLGVAGSVVAFVLLTVLIGKSWRFLAPVMFFPALLTAAAVDWPASSRLRTAIATVISVMAIFRMAILHGVVPTAADLPVAVALEPRDDDWQIPAMMADIDAHRDPHLVRQVTVVPVLRRFRHSAFLQHAMESGGLLLPASEWRVRSDEWQDDLEDTPFIVTKTGNNGPPFLAPNRAAVDTWIQSRLGKTVHLVKRYPLPDNTSASLFRHDRPDPLAVALRPVAATTNLVTFSDAIALTDCRIERFADGLSVRCDWACLKTPAMEYHYFIHLRRGHSRVAGRSFAPLEGRYPITRWEPGQGLSETLFIPVPASLSPGTYGVWLAWYRTHRRLPISHSSLPTLLRAARIGQIEY